jgi:hypothetical protein
MSSRSVVIFLFALLLFAPLVQAKDEFLAAAIAEYPFIDGTRLENCTLCHTIPPMRNSYGVAYKDSGRNFAAIENDDSDGDGFSNIVEIGVLTFPGDRADRPLRVRKPNGGETLTRGARVRIQWTASGDIGPDVRIELWKDGSKVANLKRSTPNDGRQKVLLKDTLTLGAGYTVVVRSLLDPAVFDESDAGFSILAG